MKDVLKIVFVIIGTLIGAGFASGQEMYIFFFSYGIKGIIGILISSLLMGLVISKTLNIINKNNIKTYKDFLNIIMNTNSKNKYCNIKYIVNIIINLFIIITFFIMIAGFGAYFEQELGISGFIGSIILAIICFIIFMTNVKGVVKVNEIIMPILITFLLIIGIFNSRNIHVLNLSDYIIRTNFSNWILSSILYCSYNSILLIPTLITLKSYIKSKKSIYKVSIISTIIVIVLSIIIFFILVRVDVDITNLEMPAVYVITNTFTKMKYVYGFIILASIFTTSISLGISFLQNTSKSKKSYTHIALIMCITSVLISNLGFSNLVNLLYPIFGYLGLIQILKLILTNQNKK